mgnify:CR=1 FL=1
MTSPARSERKAEEAHVRRPRRVAVLLGVVSAVVIAIALIGPLGSDVQNAPVIAPPSASQERGLGATAAAGLEYLPRAAPVRLEISAAGIDAAIEEYSDADVADNDGWVDPPSRDIVAWWSGGGTPGEPADNTVYLYGHVAQGAAVFNAINELAPGDDIIVTTEAGTIHYAVVEVLEPIDKEELPFDPIVAEATPGRLVLIGCHRAPGQGSRPTTHNLVVIASQVAQNR